MRLILENAFTWDGIYGMLDETGKKKFSIEANIKEQGRRIDIVKFDGLIAGSVRQKRFTSKKEYNLYARDLRMGEIERPISFSGKEYKISFKNWMVSGDVFEWDFKIVGPKEDIAYSCIDGGRLALEVNDDRSDVLCAILLMGLAGLAYDLRETKKEEESKKTDIDKDHPDYYDENANNLTPFKEAAKTTKGFIDEAVELGKKTVAAGKKTYEAGEKTFEFGKKVIDTVKEKVDDFLEDSPPPVIPDEEEDPDA